MSVPVKLQGSPRELDPLSKIAWTASCVIRGELRPIQRPQNLAIAAFFATSSEQVVTLDAMSSSEIDFQTGSSLYL
jgi:hypothetical protein